MARDSQALTVHWGRWDSRPRNHRGQQSLSHHMHRHTCTHTLHRDGRSEAAAWDRPQEVEEGRASGGCWQLRRFQQKQELIWVFRIALGMDSLQEDRGGIPSRGNGLCKDTERVWGNGECVTNSKEPSVQAGHGRG